MWLLVVAGIGGMHMVPPIVFILVGQGPWACRVCSWALSLAGVNVSVSQLFAPSLFESAVLLTVNRRQEHVDGLRLPLGRLARPERHLTWGPGVFCWDAVGQTDVGTMLLWY